METKKIKLPLTKDDVLGLNVGDMVLITGQLVTGRDKVHKFLFNERPRKEEIPFNLDGAIIYHCGPIIRKSDEGWRLIASGPTTSMRVEMYEHWVIGEYGIRGIIGKGGMGKHTLEALKKNGCAYLHTISGAAVYLAERVRKVIDGWKIDDFGIAEAMWLFNVEDFPAIVTMDAHGKSLHDDIEKTSYRELLRLIGL